jgi:hypothetical protein
VLLEHPSIKTVFPAGLSMSDKTTGFFPLGDAEEGGLDDVYVV